MLLFFLFVIIVLCFFLWNYQKNCDYIEEVTDIKRGERSERLLILKLRKNGFPADTIYHDLYVPIYEGKFSQIDLVLLTSVGIIVFEVKDYSGWLFGNGKQNQWTQVLNYGKEKHRFYNPIMQNAGHVSQLQKYLRTNIPLFSVIVFYGDCELKEINFIPRNTFVTKAYRVTEIIERICQENPVVNYDKRNVGLLLEQAFSYGNNPNIRIKHQNNVRDMLGEDRIYR